MLGGIFATILSGPESDFRFLYLLVCIKAYTEILREDTRYKSIIYNIVPDITGDCNDIKTKMSNQAEPMSSITSLVSIVF